MLKRDKKGRFTHNDRVFFSNAIDVVSFIGAMHFGLGMIVGANGFGVGCLAIIWYLYRTYK